MLCDNAHLVFQKFRQNIVSSKFPAALSFLNLLEAPSRFDLIGVFDFFSYDFKNMEHLITLFKSNAASREPLVIFISLMVLRLLNKGGRGNKSNGLNLVYARCYSSLSMPHQALI